MIDKSVAHDNDKIVAELIVIENKIIELESIIKSIEKLEEKIEAEKK